MSDTRKAAALYIERGWAVVPIERGEKAPKHGGWDQERISRESIPSRFLPDQNIGIILGKPSNGLLDVDVDEIGVLPYMEALMPVTGGIFGRQSKPRSHWIYQLSGADEVPSTQFKHPNFGVVLELRCGGSQTVFPPSVHPSGEEVAWEGAGKDSLSRISKVKIEPLREGASAACAAWLIGQHWTDGQRDSLSAAVAGMLLRGGWSEDRVNELIRVVSDVAGDADTMKKLKAYRLAEKIHSGSGHVPGFTRLCEICGEEDGRLISSWLNINVQEELAIAELNASHAVLFVGGKCLILNEQPNPQNPESIDITLSAATDLKLWFSNHTPIKRGKQLLSPVDVWISSKSRRQYDGMVFAPGRQVNGYYNLWRGFGVRRVRGSGHHRFLDHTMEVICSGEQRLFDYVLEWMADAIQNPTSRPGTSIAMRGNQGTGKTFFCKQFGLLYGQHWIHVTSPRLLVGNFNAHLKDKLLVFADEAFWAGDKSSEGVLKAMITEDTIPIEFKGKDVISLPNYLRLLVSTNHSWVVPTGLEERRFLILDVSDERRGDRGYFNDQWSLMEGGGRENLLDFLLSYPLGRVDLRAPPVTTALAENALRTLDPVRGWWYSRLLSGSQVSTTDEWHEEVLTDLLYAEFLQHARDLGVSARISETLFGITLRREIGVGKSRKKVDGVRRYVYQFPPLAECRKAWDRVAKFSSSWDEEGGATAGVGGAAW